MSSKSGAVAAPRAPETAPPERVPPAARPGASEAAFSDVSASVLATPQAMQQAALAHLRQAVESVRTADTAAPPERSRRIPWRRLNRRARVLLILLAVWVLNLFDLGFTLHQARSLHFKEMNPVAARLLHQPPALLAYKFLLLGTGSGILIWLRRHPVAELACWLLLASNFYVAVRWHVYYERLLALPADAFLPTGG